MYNLTPVDFTEVEARVIADTHRRSGVSRALRDWPKPARLAIARALGVSLNQATRALTAADWYAGSDIYTALCDAANRYGTRGRWSREGVKAIMLALPYETFPPRGSASFDGPRSATIGGITIGVDPAQPGKDRTVVLIATAAALGLFDELDSPTPPTEDPPPLYPLL